MLRKSLLTLAIGAVSLTLQAQTSIANLKCTLQTTSSGSKFATRTTETITAMMVVLTTGRATGGGIASLLSETSDFASEVTDLEIKGSGRGTVAWMGAGGRVTRGGFKINRVTGDYFGTYKYELDDGTYREDIETGNCVALQKAF